MRVRASRDGVTVRVIAGTHAALIALDLVEGKRAGCLGFSIERTDLETGERRWLPNMLRFPEDDRPASIKITTASAPLQKFRWGDYTVEPGRRYRYRVIARHGKPAEIVDQGVLAEKLNGFDAIPGGVSVDVRTEDCRDPQTAVFFNRGAAASKAYNDRFGDHDPEKIPAAMTWLSRGLEEGLLAFLARAQDKRFGLHAAIYEFHKPELVAALKAAHDRGADVELVYHAPRSNDEEKRDTEAAAAGKPPKSTAGKNAHAIKAAGITFPAFPRTNTAIMHDKYVVLLKDNAPVAVWTGSTNWTEGGIYGQLNVGHAIDDHRVAETYDLGFRMMKGDPERKDAKAANEKITPLPGLTADTIPHGITPLFSPQSELDMLRLYADVCKNARLLMVSAPFQLHELIKEALKSAAGPEVLRYALLDSEKALGGDEAIEIMDRDPSFSTAVATTLKTRLHAFQARMLEDQTALLQDKESFHHAGIHIHTKIILADPLGPDPILIMGSANFSKNSTTQNDSNVLIFRGDTALTDIYAAEFMRMFEHYLFRYRLSEKAEEAAKAAAALAATAGGAAPPAAGGGAEAPPLVPTVEAAKDPASVGMGLKDTDRWSDKYYVPGSREERDRLAFVGRA